MRMNISDPGKVAAFIASHLNIPVDVTISNVAIQSPCEESRSDRIICVNEGLLVLRTPYAKGSSFRMAFPITTIFVLPHSSGLSRIGVNGKAVISSQGACTLMLIAISFAITRYIVDTYTEPQHSLLPRTNPSSTTPATRAGKETPYGGVSPSYETHRICYRKRRESDTAAEALGDRVGRGRGLDNKQKGASAWKTRYQDGGA